MDFTEHKSFEIPSNLLESELIDTFHNILYIRDIKSIPTVLKLLNSKNTDNYMIVRGNYVGIIIVFSELSNKYYLFYKDPAFYSEYTKAIAFKEEVNSNTDEYSSEQLGKLLQYFIPAPDLIFKLIKNTEPIKYKYINLLDFPNDYVIKYSRDMRLPARIVRNPVFNEISIDKTSYYNFIIDTKGIVIGEVVDSLETGVVHHLLVDELEDEVYIAGEIKISNNELEYNFYSDTYSALQNILPTNPILLYYLEILVGKIFKLHKIGTKPLQKITLMHTILLPRNPFNKEDITRFCSQFKNKIVKVPGSNRRINTTYNDLPPVIQAQIIADFNSNSNLLCYDSIDKLFPSIAPVVNVVEELTIFDTIENELKKFGLNIKLGTMEELKAQFIKLINDPLNFATFKEGITVDVFDSKSIEFNRVRSDMSIEKKTFTFKKTLSRGMYNKTDIYVDQTNNNKEYILRSSIKNTIEDQFKSFYENLKHFILYIIIRKRLGNIKFIPQPYHFGLQINATLGGVTLYMIMEKGELSLDKYLVKPTLPTLTPEDIKKIIFSIYCNLYELSSLTIREGDISTLLKFKHNDFKCNNLVVSKNGVPLIIDFGLSRFTLTDADKSIEFISCEPGIDKYYKSNGYNIIHDMLQLIASLNMVKKLVVKPFEILKFINNKNSNILDTDVIMREMRFQFPGVNLGATPLFQKFYDEFDLENCIIYSDDYEKYTIEITPEELAYNIGLTVKDRIIDQFEYKYKKYKTKYLNLKISSRAVLMRY
jgi:hypothetical protein